MNRHYFHTLLVGAIVGVSACGYLAEKGEEPRGDSNLPVSGVGKFEKQDYYCDTQLMQPFLISDPVGTTRSGEPFLLMDGNSIRVFYAQRHAGATSPATIYSAELLVSHGTGCRYLDATVSNTRELVFTPPLSFSADAPTVVRHDGIYSMWFEKGQWEGIGYAQSTDGINWTIVSPTVLAPNQDWEGGTVGSPSVVWVDGRYRMWYEGNVLGQRAIGHAVSANGVDWHKSDADGHTGTALGTSGEGVRPVLLATQRNWEYYYPDDPWGRVGEPYVILHETPTRRLFYMYYAGNIQGSIDPDAIDPLDASIGLASSEDGLVWDKADSFSEPDVIADEINPVMDEKLPITFDPDRPEGSSNVFNSLFIVDEAEPAVLELVPNQLFIMLWHQVDFVNLSVNLPPEDPSKGPSTFTGGSGIGFACVGNLPF